MKTYNYEKIFLEQGVGLSTQTKRRSIVTGERTSLPRARSGVIQEEASLPRVRRLRLDKKYISCLCFITFALIYDITILI